MIEKIPDQIPVQTGEWRGTTFDIIPKETFGMACRKINELVDAVNKLETMAKNTNTVLKSLVEENNIHERQIDKLQMMLEPHKCESRPENVQDEIDKAKREGRVLFPNPADVATALTKSLRMDKEFAEDECVRLQNELNRTRKALDVAVDALKEINDRYESEEQRGREEDDSPDWWDFSMDAGEILAKALEQITKLEQKDVK